MDGKHIFQVTTRLCVIECVTNPNPCKCTCVCVASVACGLCVCGLCVWRARCYVVSQVETSTTTPYGNLYNIINYNLYFILGITLCR